MAILLAKFERYLWIYTSILSFVGGWYINHKVETVQYQKSLLEQKTAAINQRNYLLDLANKNTELYNKKEMELQSQLNAQLEQSKIKDKELDDAKVKLNRTNHVNAMLVRAMDGTGNNSMSSNPPPSSDHVADDTRVSAYEFAKWGKGLKDSFDNCRTVHNATIEYYNKQRKLMNSNVLNNN